MLKGHVMSGQLENVEMSMHTRTILGIYQNELMSSLRVSLRIT